MKGRRSSPTLPVLTLCLILVATALGAACRTQSQDYPITPVPFTEVEIADTFWLPRMRANREITIPYALKMSEETGRIANFAVAGTYTFNVRLQYRLYHENLLSISPFSRDGKRIW